VTAVTSPLSLTDLTGKHRYSPCSDCCANHQGKTESRSSTSSASGATGSSASPDLRPRPQPRPREKVSASRDPRPRPQEKSPPRPTSGLGLGRRSPPRPTWASDRLRYRGYIITLPCSIPKIQILKFSQTRSKFKMNFKFHFKMFVCELISTNKL
jgi:hypothetical protein